MNGNIVSYSVSFNGKKQPEMVQDNNDLAVSIGMLNAEKVTNARETAKKKVGEATEKGKKKTDKAWRRIQNETNCCRGFSRSSTTRTSLTFLLWLMHGCVCTSDIPFRQKL